MSGVAAAKDLAAALRELEALWPRPGSDDFLGEKKASRIEGIGETMAEAIIAHFNQPRNRALVERTARARRGARAPAAPPADAAVPWPARPSC